MNSLRSTLSSFRVLLLVLAVGPLPADNPPPLHLTAEQDHQRLLDLLHITSLRRGPDGDPKSPNAANFDLGRKLARSAGAQRFAIGFIGSSGEGGARILRRNFGEQVENIASTSEYHWMAGNFLKYAGRLTPNDLPVDSHELIALCAPRPVFIGSGSQKVEGGWVDAKGMFLGAVGAGPVYRLLGKQEGPGHHRVSANGDFPYRRGHRFSSAQWRAHYWPNWSTFLVFASRYIKGRSIPAGLGQRMHTDFVRDRKRLHKFH